MTELFRRQAVDFQRQKFHGSIVLTRTPWHTGVAAFFVLLVLALVVFALTQGFARKETVSGMLIPPGGVLRLVAPQASVVMSVPTSQGTRVTVGQTMVWLSGERWSATGPTQEAVARSLAVRQDSLTDELTQQGRQVHQQAFSLDARMAAVEAGLAQQAREIVLQRERVQLARDVADRYPELVRSGAVSPVETSEKQTALLDQQSRLSELERAGDAAQAELATLRGDRAALPLQASRESSRMQREVQALVQVQAENESHRDMLVVAPRAGEVATLLVAPGQSVVAGQTLATLLPVGAALEAELWVPTHSAGFVHAGMKAWLRVDAFPYARYGQLPAHVREVSSSAVTVGDLNDPTNDAMRPHQGAFRVMVTLDADPPVGTALDWRRLLKAGMRVQVSLVAERRTLIEWALEPLQSLRVAAK